MIFTIGNLITLGIVALALILYRLADKNNRPLEKVKKYAEKCKEEIAAYAEEKSMAVKNFGIDLDVEKKAAHQLMKSIQKLTEEELAKKSESIARIEEHINAFQSSLEELNGMTARVQENLNRIRDESAFVENTGKRVSEAREKFEQYERALGIAEKNLAEAEGRLERKNAENLEQAANEVIASAKSMVSDFEATAQVIERKVEEHRGAVIKIEKERETVLAHDLELVKKTLKDAVENAGKRADKMEDAALVKLREQAHERITHTKTFFEEKIKSVQETLKNEQGNINEKLKSVHDKLNAEIHDINAKQKSIHQEWVKSSAELENMAKKQKEEITFSITELQTSSVSAVKQQSTEINSTLEKQMESWKLLCRDTEQNIISANEKRLEEYSNAHSEAANRLAGLADDAGRLESELRLSMKEAITRVRNDFSLFEKEAAASMETTASAFSLQAQGFRSELEQMDSELNEIRQQAYDNVSEKLSVFENNFTGELGKRTSEIGRQIADWQAGLLQRFESSADKIASHWQQAEERITAEQRKNIGNLGERLTDDLDRLKQEALAFEKGIREEMLNVEETRSSFVLQIKQELADIRAMSENEVKNQIGQYQISMQETLRQKQRELEKEIEEISDHSKTAYASLDSAALNTRKIFDEWQNSYNTRMREMDNSLEDLRRHSRETAIENDERVSQFRQDLDDIRRELGLQKKIFDQTGELKQELERDMEEINANLDRLEQRRNEITQLESELTHVKRLEDEVNRKMLSFLSEQHRLEVMEKNFERIVKTSQSVETKLAQISTSDDILTNVQIQIRKLEDSIKETDEKYQRIERKSEVLEETNEGIERNFKALQKTETAIKNADTTINALSDQFENIRSSIEALAAENEKAMYAAEKISTLDESLTQIEKRIVEMNVAREWLARTETELKALDKDTREHLKLAKGLIDREGRKTTPASKGAPPPQDRDNVLRLRDQGWTVEEIANAMNMGRGEVELILEIGSRG